MSDSQNKITKEMLEHLLRPAKRLIGVPKYSGKLPSSDIAIPANCYEHCAGIIKGQ